MRGGRLNWIEAQLHGYFVYAGAAAPVTAFDLNQVAKRLRFWAASRGVVYEGVAESARSGAVGEAKR